MESRYLKNYAIEAYPLYSWADGWWIGRVTAFDPSLIHSLTQMKPTFGNDAIAFVLFDPEGIPRSWLSVWERGRGQDKTFDLDFSDNFGPALARAKPESGSSREPGRFAPEVGENAILTHRRRWRGFFRKTLWNLHENLFQPQEFPVFLPDQVFSRAAEAEFSLGPDFEAALDDLSTKGALSALVKAATRMLKRVFATDVEAIDDTSVSLKVEGTELHFWWNPSKADVWRGQRMGGVVVAGGTIHQTPSLQGLLLVMQSGILPTILPKSQEAEWDIPGQLTVPIDFTLWKVLGLLSPFLQPNATFSEWAKSLDA